MINNSPEQLLAYKKLGFTPIEVNAYSRPFEDEIKALGNAELIRIYRDMLYIREFEKTLELSRKQGLKGYKFPYASHLSIGQEAIAVGEAHALEREDMIFGTHRSHGEFIAKALRAIELSTEEELKEILLSYPTPTYKAVENELSGNFKNKAEDFILYGAFSEIFARSTGLQRGLGGSMHLHFAPFGIYPSNAIVGGSAPLALGAALFNRVNSKRGIAVANLGDGALNCGSVYEAIAFATMNQFKGLWKEKKGLPLLFVVSDNLYARGGNTKLETGSYDNPARLGAGFTADQMRAESVNGLNPLAVLDAVSRRRKGILNGEGASLINCITYRHGEHSIGDSSNRDEREVESWKKLDPLAVYPELLIEKGVMSASERAALEKEVRIKVERAYALAVSDNISPKHDLKAEPDFILRHTFNNAFVTPSSTSYGLERSDKYLSLKEKGNALTIRDAIELGIIEGFMNDATLVAYGEDVRGWQSESSVFYGLERILPYERLFNTPISESAIVGAEVGYAMCGGSVLGELLYADFLTRAADEIINQAAKWQALSGGTLKLPLTLRLPIGRSYGGQHSQDLSGLIARVPGLKVFYPATPYDCLAVMRYSLRSSDPCVIFEPKEYYRKTEEFKAIPSGDYPLENTSLKSAGSYATVVTIGSALYDAVQAKKESTKELEIISLVALSPIDYEPIVKSVERTGRLIVMGEASLSGGLMSDVAANIQKECFRSLKAPVEAVALDNTIIPPDGTDSGFYNLKDKLIELLK